MARFLMKAPAPSPIVALFAVLLAAGLLLAGTSARGQAVAVKAGTDGAGLELEYGFTARFGARLQLDGGSVSHRLNKTSVEYHGEFRFKNALALADWHPFADSWRMSAGLAYNNNRIDLTGVPTNGTFTIHGNTYPAASVSSLSGTLAFRKLAPYLGTGWGISPHGAGFFGSLDVGVLWQPQHVSLTAACASASQGTPACSQLQSDTAAEQVSLQDQTHVFRWWPLLQLGVGWRF